MNIIFYTIFLFISNGYAQEHIFNGKWKVKELKSIIHMEKRDLKELIKGL